MKMGKILFILICGCLISTATVTVRAQSENTIEQSKVIDSEWHKMDPEFRKLAITRSTDQTVFKQVALEDKDPEVRRLAISRLTDQSVFKQIALEDKDPEEKK